MIGQMMKANGMLWVRSSLQLPLTACSPQPRHSLHGAIGH
jgi:hypothetical protein